MISNFKFQISNSRKNRGFTIIEMLVVISIVVIFPTIVIANFPQIRLQFALSQATHRFAQDVRKTQDMVLSSKRYYDAFGIEQAVSGYGVYVDMDDLGNKKYIIYADVQPGNNEYDALDYVVESADFTLDQRGVIIKEINKVFGNNVSINFDPPNPDTTITQLNPGETEVEVVFALESDEQSTRSVVINQSGLVEVK